MPSPDPSPTATPVPEPVPSPKPTLTPEANSDAKVEVEMAKQEPALSEEGPPLDDVEPAPQETAVTTLLENSWLRVQLQPDIKSPTDSVEPMGLINRIKRSSPDQLAAERRRRVRPAGISGSGAAGAAFSATG